MRICYLTLGERLSYGVIESQVASVLRRASARHTIDWFAFVPVHGMVDRQPRSGWSRESRIHVVPLPLRSIWMSTADAERWAAVADVIVSMSGRKYDVIHARSYPAAVAARRISQRLGIPWVFDPRGVYPEELEGLNAGGKWSKVGDDWLREERALWRDAAVRICVSPSMSVHLGARCGSEPTTFVPCSGGDMVTLLEAESVGPIRLCYLGTMGLWTLPDDLLGMASWLERNVLDRTCELLVATSSAPSVVRSAAIDAGIAADRVVVERVAPDATGRVLAQCDLGLLPRREGAVNAVAWPVKASEYLMAGLPIAVYPGTSGCEEYLAELGVAVPVGHGDDGAASPWSPLSLDTRRAIQRRAAALVSLDAVVSRVESAWATAASSGRTS